MTAADFVWLAVCIFVAVTAYQWGRFAERDAANIDPLPRDLELRARRLHFDVRPVAERVWEHFTVRRGPYDREKEDTPI